MKKKLLATLLLFIACNLFGLTDLIDLAENASDLESVAETNSEVRQQLNFYFGNRVFYLTQEGDLSHKTTPYRNTYFWYRWREFNRSESDVEKLKIFEEISN